MIANFNVMPKLQGNNDTEQPIYQGARITPMESCLLIYSFAIRHKIDKSTMSDLLTLINFHLPNGALIPSSVFLLNKSLGPDYNSAKKIPYCSQCQLIIDEVEGKCLKCEEKVSSSGAIKCGSYFISFDIGSIMKSLLQQQLILDSLDKTFKSRDSAADTLRDIKDGLAYKNLRLQKYDLSCCVNTDGVAIFNSSRFSIWPLLLSINELDYRLRRKHTILAGLWFGVEKPNFNLFLQPLTEQANILGREGIKWTRNGINVTSRILFPMFAADSVARCQIQGITQFNGEFSCPWCLMKGENYKISERSHKWIFDPKESAPLRNHESFLEHLKQLRDILFHGSSATNNFGIKTASCLLKLPSFNIIDGFVFDYMHTVLLGVVRMLTFAWTDSKNHNKPFYIGSKADVINNKILQCKIPNECSRHIRELKHLKYWKAHEWKNWMLVAVTLLRGILPDCFLKHFALLVDSISILCQDSITLAEIVRSEILLKKFCLVLPDLYDRSFCSFNVHLLTHASNCVRNWGPLWGFSLFQFENYNGVLTNSFSGTREVGPQIVSRTICTQKVTSLGDAAFSNSEAKNFYNSLLEFKRFFKIAITIQNCTLLGPKKLYIFSNREKKKLNKLGYDQCDGFSYKSCIISSNLYNTNSSDTKHRVNSIIKVSGKLHIIFKLIHIVAIDQALLMVKQCTTTDCKDSPKSCKIINISNNVRFISCYDIEKCKFLCQYDNNGFLCIATELINSVELE